VRSTRRSPLDRSEARATGRVVFAYRRSGPAKWASWRLFLASDGVGLKRHRLLHLAPRGSTVSGRRTADNEAVGFMPAAWIGPGTLGASCTNHAGLRHCLRLPLLLSSTAPTRTRRKPSQPTCAPRTRRAVRPFVRAAPCSSSQPLGFAAVDPRLDASVELVAEHRRVCVNAFGQQDGVAP